MRRRTLFLGVFGLMAGFTLPGQTPPEGFTVAGNVVNSLTGTGIAGVNVTLTNQFNRYDATTGTIGDFQIGAVKAGTYDASFQKAGFFPADPRFPLRPVQAGPGTDSQHVQLEMVPAATLQGRVFDPEGKPVPNVKVEVMPIVKVGVTRDDGSFELKNLAPGSYKIVALPTENKPVRSPDGTRTQLVATYYPSGSDPSQAASVILHGGDNLPGYEFHLQRRPVYRARGIAFDDNGRPAPHVRISFFDNETTESATESQVFWGPGSAFHIDSPRPGREEIYSATDDAGSFEFPAIPSGEWTFIAEFGSTPGHPIAFGMAKATVGRRDVEDLRIHLAAPFPWSATFDWGETAGVKENRKAFVLLAQVGGLPEVHQGRMQADGSVRFEEVRAGKYRIAAASAESGYYPATVLLGNTDVTGQLVELSSVSPPLRIAFKPTAGVVRGTVDQGNGATVALIPQKFSSGEAELVRLATCSADGTFEIGSVPPGSYYALALDPAITLPSRDTLRVLFPRASSVRVEESSTASVNLRIQR